MGVGGIELQRACVPFHRRQGHPFHSYRMPVENGHVLLLRGPGSRALMESNISKARHAYYRGA